MKYSLSMGNKKTGTMLCVRAPRSTCPDSCSLKGRGCYAENFPLLKAWERQDVHGVDFSTALYAIRSLPKNSLWRLFEAGDFESAEAGSEIISPTQVVNLLSANQNRRGFGYTHYPVLPNLATLRLMNSNGLTINCSADTFEQAKFYRSLGLPTTLVVPESQPRDVTVEGVRITVCPAQSVTSPTRKITCAICGLCQVADRDYVIGFRVHGAKKKHIPVTTIFS